MQIEPGWRRLPTLTSLHRPPFIGYNTSDLPPCHRFGPTVVVKTLLDRILSVFLDPWFVLSYCIFIFAFFCFFLLALMHQKRRLARVLKLLNTEWATGPSKAEFINHFEEYREKILSQPALKRAWHEFEETLVIPSTEIGGDILNTSDVSSYLNHATVVSPNVSFNYYRSVPNLLTGLGILGTFLGLAAGVNAASSGLSSVTPEEITTSLHQLLQGSSLAFFTSIVGISFSLVFVLVNARVSKNLDQILAQLVDTIESRLTRVTSASVALSQLEEAKQTTLELKSFNTDLIFSIRQTLEENIANRLSPQLEQLLSAVENLRDDRSTDSANVITKMTEQFAEVLRNQAGNQFEQLGTTVEELSDVLRSSTRALAETQEKVREAMVSNTTKVAEKLAQTGQDIVSNVTNQLQQALGGLGATVEDQFKQVTTTLQDLDIIVKELNVNMRESQSKMTGTIEDSTATMVRAVNEVTQETSKYLASTVSNSVNDLKSATKQLTTAMNTTEVTIQSMNTFVERFSSLARVIEGTHEQIASTTKPMKEAVIGIQRTTQQHGQLLHDSRDCVVEIRATIDQLKQYADAVQRTWEDYRERFDGIDDSLKNAFEEFETGLSTYSERINQFVHELDNTAGSCISQLAAANSELTTAVEELSNVFEGQQR